MSKVSLRTEKKCLNCEAEVHSNFCSECGQKNVDLALRIKDILHDFFHDLTHFDGKFFRTAQLLMTSPGYLSKEYILGKRMKYLHPVRMYVFTSAVFFYLLYTFFVHVPKNAKDSHKNDTPEMIVKQLNQQETGKNAPYSYRNGWLVKNSKDTLMNLQNPVMLDFLRDSLSNLEATQLIMVEDKSDRSSFSTSLSKYNSIDEYLIAQHKLPAKDRDGIFKRFVNQKIINLILFFRVNKSNAPYILLDTFLHQFSGILFVSLPLVALILSMLFYNRSDHHYATHVVFLLHLYVMMFINTFMVLLLGKITDFTKLNFIGTVSFIVGLYPIYYGYKAMKNFYELRGRTAVLKFSVLLFLSSILFLILFIFYFILTLIKV